MKLDRSELETSLFDGLAELRGDRYFCVTNIQTKVTRFSLKTVEYFKLQDEYIYDAKYVIANLVHPEDKEKFIIDMNSMFYGKKEKIDTEFRVKNKNDEYIAVLGHIVYAKGHAGHASLLVMSLENRGVLTNIDGITGLYNGFEFEHYLRENRKTNELLSVLFLGVGRFSEINDVYGYEFGDKVLKEVSMTIFHMVKPHGTIFKIDGMRYAICIKNSTKETIEAIYMEIRQVLKNDIIVEGKSISLFVSGGVILNCGKYDDYSILMSGKYALTQSKRKNNGEIVYFDETLLGNSKSNMDLIRELRLDAIGECSKFYIEYQPIIDSRTETIIGSEALLRFRSEEAGVVSPEIFIPWLEKDACFYGLGVWILRKALQDMLSFALENPNFMLNVNVAYPQLQSSEFKFEVIRLLKEIGYPASNLCLEITGSCRQLDKNYLSKEITFLKSKGIKIALDDFGTGFSSMSLLREFPVDTIKIDRGIMSGIENNKMNQTMVNAITICAKDLNIRVCLEGLEERDMLNYIKRYDVDSYQGFYFSKPIGVEEFKELYNSKK